MAQVGNQPGRARLNLRVSRLQPVDICATIAMALLSAVWSWWAIAEGAYFGTVLYPGMGLLVIGTLVLLWDAPWQGDLRLSTPVRLAGGGLVGLAAWSLLSVLWTPAPDIAVADAQRILAYALSLGLGVWLCVLLGRRMQLAAVPIVFAAAVAGIVAFLALLLGGDATALLEEDGTLDFPLGYRNANAAFFGIALWPALALAMGSSLPRWVRVGGATVGTVCVEALILSQSRGSIVALVVATVVFLLAAPSRPRGLFWLVLAIVPALATLPAASSLYDAASSASPDVLSEMHTAGAVALLGMILAVVAGVLATRPEARDPESFVPGLLRGGSARLIAIAVAATVLFGTVAAVGNPVDWIGQRVEEFSAGGQPDLSEEGDRFTINAGSNRSDLWRVAINAFAEDPLFADGAGGYQYRYTRERDNVEQIARDAHSVGFEILSELGVVGVGLFGLAMFGAFSGVVRARRLGPSAALLASGALGAGAYWLVHASLDWFWAYPAVTAPVLALLGAASAPAILSPMRGRSSAGNRRVIAVAATTLAISTIPPFLSERYTNDAYGGFRNDLDRAYADLDRASSLNSLSDSPLLAEGAIAQAVEDRERAINAFRLAASERPEEWAAHYFLAELYAESDPAMARVELGAVAELNPLAPELDELRAKVEAAGERPTAKPQR